MTIDEVMAGPATACDELSVAFPSGSASTMGGTRETFGCANGRLEVDFTHHVSESTSYLVSYEFCADQDFEAMLNKVSQEFGVSLSSELIAGKEVYGAALMGNVFLDLANGG